MNSDKFSIGEISEFFNIPAPTLRFWQSKGLISPIQSNYNNYREYSLSDLMKISDIIFYKNLGVPLKEINILKMKKISEQEVFCMQHLNMLKREKELLEIRIKRLTQHQKGLSEISRLKNLKYVEEDIDTDCIISFCLTEHEKLRLYIDNPYLYSRVQHTKHPDEAQRGLTVSKSKITSRDEIIWKNCNKSKFVTVLMKESINENYSNNLNEILSVVGQKFKTGYIISRFLVTATENNKLYDFYKTYIEIID